jgi:hypothetical protein
MIMGKISSNIGRYGLSCSYSYLLLHLYDVLIFYSVSANRAVFMEPAIEITPVKKQKINVKLQGSFLTNQAEKASL